MNLRWNTEGLDRVARDVTGSVVIRITPRWVGESIRWIVGPKNSPAASGFAFNISQAKRQATAAYAKTFG